MSLCSILCPSWQVEGPVYLLHMVRFMKCPYVPYYALHGKVEGPVYLLHMMRFMKCPYVPYYALHGKLTGLFICYIW